MPARSTTARRRAPRREDRRAVVELEERQPPAGAQQRDQVVERALELRAGEVHQDALGADQVEAALRQLERGQVALEPLDVGARAAGVSAARRCGPARSPTTPGCSAASRCVSRPMPQPASSSRMPGASSSASRSARWTAWVPGMRSTASQEADQLVRLGQRRVAKAFVESSIAADRAPRRAARDQHFDDCANIGACPRSCISTRSPRSARRR